VEAKRWSRSFCSDTFTGFVCIH